MITRAQNDSGFGAGFSPPAWWRFALVATATIIFCSCSGPTLRMAQNMRLVDEEDVSEADADNAANDSTQALSQAPPAKLPPALVGIPPQPLQATPLTMESDLTANCPTCGPEACDPCGVSASDPYGPVVGPGDEYLCDGGDFGPPVGVKADWTIQGLGAEDAVAHYDTLDGRVVVTPSNRVCIYAPRFAAVRRVVSPIAHEQPVFVNEFLDEERAARAADSLPPVTSLQRHAVSINLAKQPPNLFRQRQQAGGLENLQASMDAYNSLAPYANLEIIRTGEVSDAEKALVEKSVEKAVAWTGDQTAQVVFGVKAAQGMESIKQPGIVYQTDEPNSPRLRLIKLASCGNAAPGEVVEFALRFDNVGDQVLGNLTIVDNLSTRLEYVPSSVKSSVDADFSAAPNDSGSLILRWEIKNPVEPGTGGILRFRVKVR